MRMTEEVIVTVFVVAFTLRAESELKVGIVKLGPAAYCTAML